MMLVSQPYPKSDILGSKKTQDKILLKFTSQTPFAKKKY